MTPSRSVVAFSNLPVAEAMRLYRMGAYPEHNLYGVAALERAGYEIVSLESKDRPVWERLSRASRHRLGDLDQEAQVLATRADGIISGSDFASSGLGLLRRARLLARPVACVVHQPPINRTQWLSVRGYDLAFTLSKHARDRLVKGGRPASSTVALSWGPDVEHAYYADREPIRERRVVSVGKTNRDIETLTAALDGRPAHVHGTGVQRSYQDALADMASASVVAIPYTKLDAMVGLTELNDALALSKPVVMTRSDHIDVDIEAVGCGIWVDPGDVVGWRRALERLDDLDVAREMGERGRRFVEDHWNSRICGEQIVTEMDRLMSVKRPG